MHTQLLSWYRAHARDLPWRDPDRSPWGVLVSEVMLQQTPVARVLPVWREWMERWPTPAALAGVSAGEVLKAWGRLGYPRRALRLHEAARAIVAHHDAVMPDTYAELMTLPGVGDYTAAAVASFAYGRRHVVLDTNIRRVLARAVSGQQFPGPSPTRAERDLAESLLPEQDAPAWNVALMELGALVCTARSPDCAACPIAVDCLWLALGKPEHDGPPRKGQAWHGTDRQLRGRMMAVLRDASEPVERERLLALGEDAAQSARCLAGLLADGLAAEAAPGRISLPA